MPMRYTWHYDKNLANVRKHGIAFGEAIRIFDGFATEEPDERYHYGEERVIATGLLNGQEIVVVFTDTPKGERRIISARPANRKERENYWRQRPP
ncbi:MAG TPA: hypothetical protein DCL54_04705 [Alphaproteobacteria bacterium]|nr:hypothetical protein [Alphaproteobacteria bacterium]HAJ45865.1 hypothetical protein [Alphaproteobacteria bacterium]